MITINTSQKDPCSIKLAQVIVAINVCLGWCVLKTVVVFPIISWSAQVGVEGRPAGYLSRLKST